jgi:23S rRNA maturation-related 3'-5' exoribonuclease YhaM
MKEQIKSLLLQTKREGMDNLIEAMEEGGFFTSPCSGAYHLAKAGGLAEHSFNVFSIAHDLNITLDAKLPEESIIIASLLHDLGKMGDFGKELYIPNYLKSGKISDAKPYMQNPELLKVDHEIRSVSIASKYIELTEDEYFAILHHNGLYSNLKYNIQGNETPLYLIIHTADMWASRVKEI